MLFPGLPRNRGMFEKDEISSERAMSNRTTGQIRVTICMKLEIGIRLEKNTLVRKPF